MPTSPNTQPPRIPPTIPSTMSIRIPYPPPFMTFPAKNPAISPTTIQYMNPCIDASSRQLALRWSRTVLEDSLAKRQPQAGGQQGVISLQEERRIGDVAIAKGQLPS